MKKKITYDFYYDGRAIPKSRIVSVFGNNWKQKFSRDRWGDYTTGYYTASPRE